MFEVNAHKQVKHLLQNDPFLWPHNLTLSRLVARSLNRKDRSFIHLEISDRDSFWPGLLIPLYLAPNGAVLVLTQKQKKHLLQDEIPRLAINGIYFPLYQGLKPPGSDKVWIIDHLGFVDAYLKGFLQNRQLILIGDEFLETFFREAMSIAVEFSDWDKFKFFKKSHYLSLMNFYENLNRKLFAQDRGNNSLIRIETSEMQRLQDLLREINSLPSPWSKLLGVDVQTWVSWTRLNYKKLHWDWNWQPLDPLADLSNLLIEQPLLVLSKLDRKDYLIKRFKSINCFFNVQVSLGQPLLKKPIELFIPNNQRLPNHQLYCQYLLDQCRRLILGRTGMTIILLDDLHLSLRLTSELASEFGRRVVHESVPYELNGVICCSCSWWLTSHEQLPIPDQLIFALIPFRSMELPLTSARVEYFKMKGRNWFREFLLPETLVLISAVISVIRNQPVRVAILDGRLKLRSWGVEVFRVLQPWNLLERLMPR